MNDRGAVVVSLDMQSRALSVAAVGMVDTALADLTEDLEAMSDLVSEQVEALRRRRADIGGCASVSARVRVVVSDAIDGMLSRYAAIRSDVDEVRARTVGCADHERVADLARRRRWLAEHVRTLQSISAGVMVAADWHSPSIGGSVVCNAGPSQVRVTANHDDYKRDRHPDQGVWEMRWLAEMVDNPHRRPLGALMTASGMAAFTTVLTHVLVEAGDGPLVVGRSLYHECRQLVHQTGRTVIEVPEEVLVEEAPPLSPAVVFVDSVCNAVGLPVTDVAGLIRRLADSDVLLVVDNTALSVASQPWRWITGSRRLRLIVFESLTKHAQLGLDRAAGGVIVASAAETERLDQLREHLGTNVADVVVHQHPTPNRARLERRLGRIGRNATLIAERLSRRAAVKGRRVRIDHPGLGSHPGGAMFADAEFRGGCISVAPHDDPVGFSRRFIRTALDLAAQRGVAMCEGTSFGLDTTRAYLTAATSIHSTPFLRIAAGTEDRLAIEAVAAVLDDALEIVG